METSTGTSVGASVGSKVGFGVGVVLGLLAAGILYIGGIILIVISGWGILPLILWILIAEIPAYWLYLLICLICAGICAIIGAIIGLICRGLKFSAQSNQLKAKKKGI